MNDPHVVALIYRIEHGPSVDYSRAETLDHEEASFRIKIQDGSVRFEFKDHHATEDAARATIGDYIREWEFLAGLSGGADHFRLRFDYAEIEDRRPPVDSTPGVVSLRGSARLGSIRGRGTLTVTQRPRHYPPPPAGVTLTPDVKSMYDRYMGFRQGREPLASMAYFCLTVLEYSHGKREKAAKTYGIDLAVLKKIGYLSSEKGGHHARKAIGRSRDLTDRDRRFLEDATRAMIYRAARKAQDPSGNLPKISLSGLLRRMKGCLP